MTIPDFEDNEEENIPVNMDAILTVIRHIVAN